MAHSMFESWYVPNGCGSGPGSDANYTTRWRGFIEGFIRGSGVKSVLDFGCGDWQFSKLIDWQGANYHGVDVVKQLVDRLQKTYETPSVRFSHVDTLDPELPDADLLITKDVLQHIPNADILRILPKFMHIKRWLIVNDKPVEPVTVNGDTDLGGYRLLDFTKPPFMLRGTEVFRFDHPWPKVAFYVDHR